MTEAAFVFNQDIREKKSIKNSANKKNRRGKGRVRFPSDYLTKKEKTALNSECKTWNMNHFYTWDEFLYGMPDHIKIEYLNHIINKYAVGCSVISEHVFHKDKSRLSVYLHKHPDIRMYVNISNKPSRSKKSDIEKLKKDVEYQENTQITNFVFEDGLQPDTDIVVGEDLPKEIVDTVEEDAQIEVSENRRKEDQEFIYKCVVHDFKSLLCKTMSFELDTGTNRESTVGYLTALMNMFSDSKLHISMTISVKEE